MEFGFSPHRDGGGTLHLPSPTHRHSYGMDSLQQIRRSLSRSPSKPSRFPMRRSDSSGSPISPLALGSRAFSPKSNLYDRTPIAYSPETPAPPQFKKRLALRRCTPLRSSPRNRAPSKSPRKVLTDCTDHGNSSPFAAWRPFGEENKMASPNPPEKSTTEQRSLVRLDIDDKPIKFGISRARNDLDASNEVPKTTPLKRSDGIMNLDAVAVDSPVAKRRSVHGIDFDVFEQPEESSRPQEQDASSVFFSPGLASQTPLRKTSSLRKSALHQRLGSNLTRSKPSFDNDVASPGPAVFKFRPQRLSLDGPPTPGPAPSHTPVRQPFHRLSAGTHHPHPLSKNLSPSSFTPDKADVQLEDAPGPITYAPRKHQFGHSMPLNIAPPPGPSETSFATPNAFNLVKPDPEGFKSTGLISKKNRNLDVESAINRYVMPGTPTKRWSPSKRASFPPPTGSPSMNRRGFNLGRLQQPQFGKPSTPFNLHKTSSSASFGQGLNIFGTSSNNHQRRSSFASIDGDDNSLSPCAKMSDSQSSTEDMPPTPTKQKDGSGRRKDSSLRRQTFHQSRSSLGADTFVPPAGLETPGFGGPVGSAHNSSPHTPNDSFTPPDPSLLTISARRRGSVPFDRSINSNLFSPATPTTPRDSNPFGSSVIGINKFSRMTDNEVEVSLHDRFDSVTLSGDGVFSKVYRVEKMMEPPSGFASSPRRQVWAVKKSKDPATGPNDLKKRLREVEILQALRGHEHIVSIEDHWVHNDHLYIQTEFCEEGNLKRFLDHVGNKGRLDDFRIWKILLEVTLGIRYIHDQGFIHLDIKPANILVAFDGVLKIADFGMASTWPAPPHIEGEGDRLYLSEEAMNGRYDKPCDIFALGIIMCEAATNHTLPENGGPWQRLRRGDLSDLPSLTWSSESSLDRDVNGDPIDLETGNASIESLWMSDGEDEPMGRISIPSVQRYSGGLSQPPPFMMDDKHQDSLQQLVTWMCDYNPDMRPTAEQVYLSYGCQWVERRSRAGATIFEGNWGPADDVLDLDHKVEEVDRMDTD